MHNHVSLTQLLPITRTSGNSMFYFILSSCYCLRIKTHFKCFHSIIYVCNIYSAAISLDWSSVVVPSSTSPQHVVSPSVISPSPISHSTTSRSRQWTRRPRTRVRLQTGPPAPRVDESPFLHRRPDRIVVDVGHVLRQRVASDTFVDLQVSAVMNTIELSKV